MESVGFSFGVLGISPELGNLLGALVRDSLCCALVRDSPGCGLGAAPQELTAPPSEFGIPGSARGHLAAFSFPRFIPNEE